MPPPVRPSALSKPPTSSPCQQCREMRMFARTARDCSTSTPRCAYRSRANSYACSIDCSLCMSKTPFTTSFAIYLASVVEVTMQLIRARFLGVGWTMHAILAAASVFAQPLDPVLRVAPGFVFERVYAVPRDTQGSWVSLASDRRGV